VKTERIGLFVAVALWAPLSHGQSSAPPFQIMETTIDQVHAAYKSGKLTARQLVQGYLDRIKAYDQQGPKINSIITLNLKALEEADGLDQQYKRSGPGRPSARHPNPG
jgi:Asp-tRNA(Asn)/Glu-tRNA(Gln) amidotransferase A subunit family amidase